MASHDDARPWRVFWDGIRAASHGRQLLQYLWDSERIRVRTFQCFVLNGLLFLGSILVMDYAIMPCIRLLLRHSPLTSRMHLPLEQLLSALYQLLWVFPAYFISFLVSCTWYMEIANRAYTMRFGKRREVPANVVVGFVRVLRDEAWRFLLTYSFLLQTYAVYALPFVGGVLHVLHLAWYWAFFCFEYSWALHGWSIDDRLAALEGQWVFMAGFGLPLALLSVAFPAFVSYGVVAFVFPLFVVLATVSEPRAHAHSARVPRRLPLFALSKRLGLWLVRRLDRRAQRPGARGRVGGGGGAKAGEWNRGGQPRASTRAAHSHAD